MRICKMFAYVTDSQYISIDNNSPLTLTKVDKSFLSCIIFSQKVAANYCGSTLHSMFTTVYLRVPRPIFSAYSTMWVP